MWQHTGRLPHVLPPRSYFDPDCHAREVERLLTPAWHAVATTDRLARPGDFVTTEVLGQPVIVRNCGGELRAFQNVCAHRHAVLTREPHGNAARMRCQYHGWEYDDAGRTIKVPDAPSFVPIKRGVEGLVSFRAKAHGKLVMVALGDAVDIDGELLARVTGEHVPCGAWTIDHAANWKVVVENALESYHVPQVHPSTFKRLSRAEDATHTLAATFTALANVKPPPMAHAIAQVWRRAPRGLYEHHHAFPNLMIATTDLSTFVQTVLPTSPTTSRSHAFCFVHRGDHLRVLRPALGAMVARFTRTVLREDDAMFASIQRGLQASGQIGTLGAREERVHAFQQWVARMTA